MLTHELDSIDLGKMDFWFRPAPERDEDFRILRRGAPVCWFAEPDAAAKDNPDPGFWALSRHQDIVRAAKDTATFTSTRALALPDLEIFRQPPFDVVRNLANLDDPEHARHRRLAAAHFTPHAIRRGADRVEHLARVVVEDIVEFGECDFAQDIAARLPFAVSCELMGVPRAWWPRLYPLVQLGYGAYDPEHVPGLASPVDAIAAMAHCCTKHTQIMDELVALKRDRPGNDLTSQLLVAEIDGRPLTGLELAQWFLLVMIAGTDTTQQAISQGVLALDQNPAQRRQWSDNFDQVAPTAVEELLRWSTPVVQFRRVATVNTEIGGQPISAGDTVMLLYASGNRDETVFEQPFELDLRRDPNPHLSFGVPASPHLCMGNHLGRRETQLMFQVIFEQLPDIHVTGEPDWLRTSSLNALKHLPVAFTPRKRRDV